MRLGLLSTAKINLQIMGGAAESDRVEVVAVASRDQARADTYAAEHGLARAHGSYESLLSDPDVDAVYISLPNGMHHEWTMHALRAGKHVLCEKPYSRRPAEVEAAFDLADASGLVLMEAIMYRHHPQTTKLQELVAADAVGRLCAVKTTFTFPLTDLSNVRALPELDGGALMDVGCYCVSGIRVIAGDPLRVSGEHVSGPTGIDMAFHGTMRCADDVVGQFEASFRSPERQRLEVVGTRGVIVAEAPWRTDWGGAVSVTRFADRDEPELVESIDVPEANAYRLELENLAEAVAGRAPPLLGRDDALAQSRTIDALYRSAESCQAVSLQPAW